MNAAGNNVIITVQMMECAELESLHAEYLSCEASAFRVHSSLQWASSIDVLTIIQT